MVRPSLAVLLAALFGGALAGVAGASLWGRMGPVIAAPMMAGVALAIGAAAGRAGTSRARAVWLGALAGALGAGVAWVAGIGPLTVTIASEALFLLEGAPLEKEAFAAAIAGAVVDVLGASARWAGLLALGGAGLGALGGAAIPPASDGRVHLPANLAPLLLFPLFALSVVVVARSLDSMSPRLIESLDDPEAVTAAFRWTLGAALGGTAVPWC